MNVRVKDTDETGAVVVPEVNGKVLVQLDGNCQLRVLDTDQIEPVTEATDTT